MIHHDKIIDGNIWNETVLSLKQYNLEIILEALALGESISYSGLGKSYVKEGAHPAQRA